LAGHVAQEVAAGLAYAHSLAGTNGELLRIVHRDVHPGNIMLLRAGGVKLLDFGVAKANHSDRLIETRGNVLKGALACLAPEQIDRGAVYERTDVFALGVSLWEMLASRRLLSAPTEFTVLKAVLSRAVVPPRSCGARSQPCSTRS
jgi:serine/threonine protein kinase